MTVAAAQRCARCRRPLEPVATALDRRWGMRTTVDHLTTSVALCWALASVLAIGHVARWLRR